MVEAERRLTEQEALIIDLSIAMRAALRLMSPKAGNSSICSGVHERLDGLVARETLIRTGGK